jgi:hypothetical protein
MNEHLTDIVNRLASHIAEQEGRDRKRNSEAQANFLHGIEHLIIQLWKGTQIHEGFEGGINKRAGWYSQNSRYRDPNLTYKQTSFSTQTPPPQPPTTHNLPTLDDSHRVSSDAIGICDSPKYYTPSVTLYGPLKWLPAITPNLCNST